MVTHPIELAGLDLYTVWTSAQPLNEVFDPFRFEHRMAAYRQMIHATNADGQFGPDNRRNPMWGLMFQHQWQFSSGRLGWRDGRIDPDSPWGYGNYALCVIPWLGATAAGVVPKITIAPPATPARFGYQAADFAAAIADWRSYFETVMGDTDNETVRFVLWKAHKTSLDIVATNIAHIDPAPLAPAELEFLQGWCRMVDYLWAAAWRTDFDFMTEYGLDILPDRLLGVSGAKFPVKVHHNVRNVVALARTPKWRHWLNLRLWQRVMRTKAARDEVVTMLDALFNPNSDNKVARRRMIGYLLRP
ncbi:Leg1-related protein [Kibdelosporangium philippinense]|uniref:Leg1-related protein n=1 Tax=Kibdelosporangium philippinense TaxID=211113 RepID=A0ABS8ZAA9_9PSEU|nr:Leg1-related protein [Kibdelosporangium philippinense]MCE7004814.1 Leg1-related protein [Kibdelosporangium philippinense]